MCWIGGGYLVANPLASAVTLLIGACYVAGAVELYRYRQATSTLAHALASLDTPPGGLADWLDRLHPGLRGAVRMRIEGARAALPGPALTPYLVGLLVLLGMLGTLLGMVATLRGTGTALDSAADLDAIRASLAAPVKGLGFAFGTSIAGVATSAMLGLLSALYRRERAEVTQRLDAKIATTLRVFSHAHQRDETFRLMQRQADAMPALVDRLQTMIATLEQQGAASNERQIASQQAFLDHAQTAYARLASSVGQSLKDSAADSARIAGAALAPVVEATMAGLARETAALHASVSQSVERHLDGLSSGFEATTKTVASTWTDALAQQRQSGETLVQQLRASLDQFAATFDQRSTDLVDRVSSRAETAVDRASTAWREALSQQQQSGEKLADDHRRALEAAAATFERHAASLLQTIDQSHANLQAELASRDEQRLAAWTDSLAATATMLRNDWQQTGEQAAAQQQQICDTLARTAQQITEQTHLHAAETIAEIARLVDAASEAPKAAADLMTELASRDEQRLAAWTDSLAAIATTLRNDWQQTGEQAAARQQQICDTLAKTAQQITEQTHQHAAETIAEISRLVDAASEAPKAAADLMTELASRDEQRLAAWTDSLAATATTLRNDWQQTGEQAAAQQQQICDTLAKTAQQITEQTHQHAAETIAEIARLVDAASEAPKAAADVIAELRANLADSMARDTAMLDERNRLLDTLGTLLDAVNHASTDQRTAIDALVSTSADLLERVGGRFGAQVDHGARRLDEVAAQMTGSAVEVASLGETFGAAVQRFGASNDKLVEHLQRIEAALDKSLARSDEQLAYYVAQAREVVDLSVLSQKQIIDDLQRLADSRASLGD
ncbi:protein of unknown function [Paraburkholderia caballeronis]|uniref:DUF802 domain-containing protein n=1 Tax=Paraburkholderia caballeronis TaxID=416943 RepID=A0A1H7MY90_9BURK|nr:uncharacterized protein DUF802 [Paraburkholderia caballeronis]PXX01899.1 uncharacterized protein DUF802 [Paraburkholderia caballeronis]RAK01056.1 uncharacterized protein DUF802 [Paraburkholderia caballeronis]SEC00528.1 protein of unknown function [Paraburkholderia caballeronis]SEL16240.1 protein of unknown function [Paraburkholderia caballeronis]